MTYTRDYPQSVEVFACVPVPGWSQAGYPYNVIRPKVYKFNIRSSDVTCENFVKSFLSSPPNQPLPGKCSTIWFGINPLMENKQLMTLERHVTVWVKPVLMLKQQRNRWTGSQNNGAQPTIKTFKDVVSVVSLMGCSTQAASAHKPNCCSEKNLFHECHMGLLTSNADGFDMGSSCPYMLTFHPQGTLTFLHYYLNPTMLPLL